MTRTTTGFRQLRALSGAVLVIGLLAACEDGTGFLQGGGDSSGAKEASGKGGASADKDTEAPEVFQISEAALWDGRPSLGGVWVAHPDVTDPRRVIIRNGSNDTSVVGALFRRERDNPGPRIQASSDAADALGMLAGAPVELTVTALIREPAAETEAAEPAEAEVLEETVEISETELDPINGAAAAIEAAEPIPTVVEPAAAEDTPRRGFRWPWSRQPAATATAAAATGAAAGGSDDTAPPAAPASGPVSDLGQPYIQAGIFSQEDNADRAATRLRSAGMTPSVLEQAGSDKTFWRVLVGPSQTRSEQSALLTRVRETGFSDAYTVTN